jgi:OOP family OmpA-OmpF porin
MRLTPAGKVIVLLLVVGVAVGGYKLFGRFGGSLLPEKAGESSVVPTKADLPSSSGSSTSGTGAPVTLPGSDPGCTDKPEIRMLGYAWNAQMGIHFANGGAQATSGSLMCKHGVNFKWSRQDDNSKLQENLVAFATDLSRGTGNPGRGVHFVTIMGDGGAAFIKGLNDTLRKIGPEYQAKIVGVAGYSRGEDKFMGPADWKSNPTASRGGLCAGVIRDGDWNIAQKWLGDNGLRNNPDEKTWDPDALNWVNASDYIDACQKYIAGYSEDRPVVRNGKRTGETKHITVNSVVTWTPGDVQVAQKKGGLVSIVSTKEYSSQMPCVIIGIDKWMRQNRPLVEGMLQAIAEGGDAVKSSEAALHRASEVSAAVYKESGSGADYWEKYFKGTQEKDATGMMVDLGGSSVNNLADSLLSFGLVTGSSNLVAATYRVFGDVAHQQYSSLLPDYPSADQIIDTSYMADLGKQAPQVSTQVAAIKPKYNPSAAAAKPVLSKRSWNIHFDTGRATIASDSKHILDQLRRELLVASGTIVEIHGHTDNQGNVEANMKLSEERAFAVKSWLQSQAPVNFPKERLGVFSHGQTNPVAPNSTESGRAQNRRVEIVLRSAS